MADDERLIPRRLINPEREEAPRSLLDLIEQGPFDLDTSVVDVARDEWGIVDRGVRSRGNREVDDDAVVFECCPR